MTAETLKSFIPSNGNTTFRTTTSSSATNSSYYKKNIYVIWLWICLILIAIITLLCILGFTIWNTNRISKLEKNLTNMYERLGLNYLDELEKDDFYSKNILDDTDDDTDDNNSDEGILLDSYEDEHEMDNDNDNNNDTNNNNNNNNFNNDNHDEQDSGEYDYDNEDDTNNDNIYDDNFYDDFGKFKKTKEINEINQENKKRTSPSLSLSSSTTTSNHDNFNDRLNRRKRGENYMEYRNQQKSESIINQQKLINSNNYLYRDKNENRNDLRHMTTERQKYLSAHYQKIHHQGNNNNNALLSGSQRRQNNSRSRIIAIHLTLNGSNPYSYIDDKHYYNHYSTKDITETFYDGDLYTVKFQQKSLFSSPIQQKLYLDKIIKYENGIIRIKLNGIYLIYGQVYYHNNINTNGFNIFHNDEPILQCVITIPTSASSLYDVNLKSNTCHTSGIVYLKSDDIIYIRDLHKNRAVSLKDSKSFIGLIRLG